MSNIFPDREMPSDVTAEKYILGGIQLDNKLMSVAAETLKAKDFYNPIYRRIYAAMEVLYQTNRDIDAVTIADVMRLEGSLESIGGAPYIANLTMGLPFFSDIDEYVTIVHKASIARQLITVCNMTTSNILAQDEDIENVVDLHEQMIYELRTEQDKKGFEHIGSASVKVMKHQAAILNHEVDAGVLSTGFPELDDLTGGLAKTDLIIVAGRPGMGKAQSLGSKLLTPHGWIKMRDVKLGDRVAGSDGQFYQVTGVFPQGEKEMFKVAFNDHTATETCAEHLWATRTRNERKGGRPASVKTAKEIGKSLIGNDGIRLNHSVQYVAPIQFPEQSLPLDPYVLGALIADGGLGTKRSIGFYNPEADIVAKMQSALPPEDKMLPTGEDGLTYRITRLHRNNQPSKTCKLLRILGLMGMRSYEKSIPKVYQIGSVHQRLELLRGLIDCDGYLVRNGSIEYSTASRQLAENVADLVRSLGGKCAISSRLGRYTSKGVRRETRINYRLFLSFMNDIVPVSSMKHLAKWNPIQRRSDKKIESVTSIGFKPAQCISVDSPDSLYVTDDFILTHNSGYALTLAQNVAKYEGVVIGIFSLEMSTEQLVKRLLLSESSVNSYAFKRGFLQEGEKQRLTHAIERFQHQGIYIDDSSGMTSMEIRAKARQLKQRHRRLDLIVIDYLQLMSGGSKRSESRQQEVSLISRELKGLAKDLDVPVVALSQLSRAPELRKSAKPLMSDLRESGSIEQDADVVMFVYREAYYKETEENKRLAEIIVGKSRHGPTGTINLAWLPEYTRFEKLQIS